MTPLAVAGCGCHVAYKSLVAATINYHTCCRFSDGILFDSNMGCSNEPHLV